MSLGKPIDTNLTLTMGSAHKNWPIEKMSGSNFNDLICEIWTLGQGRHQIWGKWFFYELDLGKFICWSMDMPECIVIFWEFIEVRNYFPWIKWCELDFLVVDENKLFLNIFHDLWVFGKYMLNLTC